MENIELELTSMKPEEGFRASRLPGTIAGLFAPPCPSGTYYTVAPGDSLRSIALRLDAALEELLRANPGAAKNRLLVGQRLCVPEQSPAQAEAEPEEPVSPPPERMEPEIELNLEPEPPENEPAPAVQSCKTRLRMPANSTVVDLLMRYDIPYEAMSLANEGVDLQNLRAGQILCIPETSGRGPCPAPCNGYAIPSGKTLKTLAVHLGAAAFTLLMLNPCLAPSEFREGTLIHIP